MSQAKITVPTGSPIKMADMQARVARACKCGEFNPSAQECEYCPGVMNFPNHPCRKCRRRPRVQVLQWETCPKCGRAGDFEYRDAGYYHRNPLRRLAHRINKRLKERLERYVAKVSSSSRIGRNGGA